MGLGILAAVHYFQQHEASSLELSLVGLGVFLFGFLLPALVFYLMERLLNHLRKRMLEHVSKIVITWTEGLKQSDQQGLKNPLFWTHIVLVAIEEFGQEIDHPMMSLFLEISPYIRQELKART